MNQKELLEKKNDLITRAEETLNKAKTEARELTEAEMAELAEIRDNVKKIKDMLEMSNFFSKEEQKPMIENSVNKIEEKVEKETAEVRAFEDYVRGIKNNLRSGELDFGSNGAVVPTTIANRIIRKVYDICPVLERSSKYNVKGTLNLPFYKETAGSKLIDVAYHNEFVDIDSNVGEFDTVTLTGYLAGALVKISRSLINNAQFNITDFIVDQMAYSIKRFIEHELLVGHPGSGTDLDPARVLGLSTLDNKITAAATSAITADEVIQLHDKIKDDYQSNAIWIMSSATRTALRLLKTQYGLYILNDDISSPFGTTLLGKPVYVSDNMPNMGASATTIYYGDMSGLATKFNEEINIEVLRERYAPQHAIGVIGWFEFDSKVENEQKIAKLVMAAS